MMCPKCRKSLTHQAGLEFCEGCGYETPESERRPVAVRALPVREVESDETRGKQMETVTIQSTEQLAAAISSRVADIDRALVQLSAKAAALREERSKLAKIVAILEPGKAPKVAKAKATPTVDEARDCEVCGRSFGTLQAVSVHRARAHGPGWDTTANLRKAEAS